jgi:dihydrofolate reductase
MTSEQREQKEVDAVAPPPTVCLIVAAGENGVIGSAGKLPWRMPSDLKTFRRLTLGKPVVMGRRTWTAIGKALEGRDNIVVTRDPGFAAEGAIVVRSLDEALSVARRCASARGAREIMVIGGADIYSQAMDLADRIYLTRIHAAPEGDARFPDPDPTIWRQMESTAIAPLPLDEHRATLLIFERIRA